MNAGALGFRLRVAVGGDAPGELFAMSHDVLALSLRLGLEGDR